MDPVRTTVTVMAEMATRSDGYRISGLRNYSHDLTAGDDAEHVMTTKTTTETSIPITVTTPI